MTQNTVKLVIRILRMSIGRRTIYVAQCSVIARQPTPTDTNTNCNAEQTIDDVSEIFTIVNHHG